MQTVADNPPLLSPETAPNETKDTGVPQKREREVSLEPITPLADGHEASPVRMREKDPHLPAKKNRTQLATTAEEQDSGADDVVLTDATTTVPATSVDETATKSAPHPDTLDTQVSSSQEQAGEVTTSTTATAAAATTTTTITTTLSAKTPADPAADAPSASEPPEPLKPSTPPNGTKRSRDDADKDASPRPAKRPTPPPAPASADQPEDRTPVDAPASPPVDPAPSQGSPKQGSPPVAASKRSREDDQEEESTRPAKRPTPPPAGEETGTPSPSALPAKPASTSSGGGFLAYASTSSPFAAVKGPPVFGSKPKSPSPWATATATASSSPNPFASAASSANPFTKPSASPPSSPKPAGAQTPSRRTGFEAFASRSSPFAAVAAARARSPGRSKSPSAAASKAFSAYATGGAQGLFSTPAAKRARADSSASAAAAEKGEGDEKENSESPEEGAEKAKEDGAKTFREQLREENGDGNSNAAAAETSIWGEVAANLVDQQELATGEEGEVSISSVRGKMFVLDGQNGWKERGTGSLRLNVQIEGESNPRLVMRKDAVFSVLLNAPLFKGMHCTLTPDKRFLRLSAFEAGKFEHYNIRISNPTAAETLHRAVEAWTPGHEDKLRAWMRDKANVSRLPPSRRL